MQGFVIVRPELAMKMKISKKSFKLSHGSFQISKCRLQNINVRDAHKAWAGNITISQRVTKNTLPCVTGSVTIHEDLNLKESLIKV